MMTVGAARKYVSHDTYPDSEEHKNRAANIMFSTNSKRAIAKKQNERVLRRKFEKNKAYPANRSSPKKILFVYFGFIM